MEHVFTESMFLVGFVIFIAAILVLDMLVIDRKAHVVSIKEAGSWTAVWIILALAFAVFIYFHGDMVHGIENFDDLKLIASRYASHLKLDPNDYEGSLQQYRHYMTISYISGYLIEKTLSVDNLFVMMMIFTSFGVNKKDYQHVLNWGILGASYCASSSSSRVLRSSAGSPGYYSYSEDSWFTAVPRCSSTGTRRRKSMPWSIR